MTIVFGSSEAQEIVRANRELHREREREVETIECHKCGGDVELTYETEKWEQDELTGDWLHAGFGPGVGYCSVCRIMFVHSWDGMMAYYEKYKQTGKQRRRHLNGNHFGPE